MKILITGAAGFIGSALAYRLASEGNDIIAIDNINDYYDPRLKTGRLERLGITIDKNWHKKSVVPAAGYRKDPVLVADIPWLSPLQSYLFPNLKFIRLDICDFDSLMQLCHNNAFDVVVNMAAQAGVRYSIDAPLSYGQTNLMGFLNVLECCRQTHAGRLVFASSSSVYGNNCKTPFSESDRVDSPVSLYAATKKSNELMAAAYNSLYSLSTVGLRFFTVYGPWGRPDMAPMLFSDAILENKPIKVFNYGNLSRDFTYIDDIVEGMTRIVESSPSADARIYNIGRGHSERLKDFISLLERNLGKKAVLEMLPMQPGDVHDTWADTSRLRKDFGYTPTISLEEGIAAFARWRLESENRRFL